MTLNFTRILTVRCILGAAVSVWLLGEVKADDAASSEAWLTWRNGDELKGQLNRSPDERISWVSPFFSAPLTIRADQLEGIRFPSTRADNSEPDPSFRLYLVNGDKLEGNLTSVNADSITFECSAFESPIILKRGAVERVLHVNSEQLCLSGPGDLTSWISTGRDRKPTDWFADLSGSFGTHQWSGNLFRAIELPEQVEVAFSVSFPRGKPELEIGLLKDPSRGPMLETWDNHLVLTFKTHFVPIMELSEDATELSFRLFWNQASGEVRLCDQAGELLASLDSVTVERPKSNSKKDGKDLSPFTRGFSILNRTPELRLQALNIQEWDGNPAPLIDLERPRLFIAGEKPRFQTADINLKAGSDHLTIGSRKVPLQDFRELIFVPDSPGKPEAPITRVAWFSGTNISGEFRHVDQGQLTLQPSWAESPVTVKLTQAKEIRFPHSELPPEHAADHLTADGLSLFGTTRVIPDAVGPRALGWQPPGADGPIPFADETKVKVTRPAHPAIRADLTASIGQARVFLKNDEILSGELISIETDKVNFTSRTTGQLAISSDLIRAIDIGSAGRVLSGFGDPEWEVIEEEEDQVTIDKQKAVLTGGIFGNSSILLGDTVQFKASWEQPYGAFTLRLFAESPSEESPSIDVVFAAQGNRLYVGKLRESGAFSFSGEQVETDDNQANFKINATDKKVTVHINGRSKPALTIPINPEKVSGNGLFFKMGGGWPGWNQSPNEISFSEFVVERSPGSVPQRVIDPSSREKALTIPRIHQDDAPTHLLVAPNGDLLRGRLLSGVGTHLRFESKGKTFDLPRQRVSALIWLRPATEEDAAPSETKSKPFHVTHRFILNDGSRLRLAAERVDGSQFVGRSEFLGECRVVIDNVHQVERGPATPAGKLPDASVDAYRNWSMKFTPEPKVPGASEGSQSPLIGKPAPAIKLTTLEKDTEFELSAHKGKVVVLDFWATWCGPCIKAMPEVMKAVEVADSEEVVFYAINQAESEAIVSSFLEKRGWTGTPVAFDFGMKVSGAYDVKGIPHTVVVDRDGNIAWIHSGYTEDLGKHLFEAIKKCL